jgi:alpha-L-fucosidase
VRRNTKRLDKVSMKRVLAIKVGICVSMLSAAVTANAQAHPNGGTRAEREVALRNWQDERFGMFIHWGAYAVPAGVHGGKPIPHLGEWIMHHGRISHEDYREYAKRFNPEQYDPVSWVALAKETGMKYMVVTAKHHDGFALFDSAVTDWDAVQSSGAKRDLLKPLVDECHRQGVPLGFHYSQALDWWHPGGGRYGSSWDAAQQGSFDDYLAKISVPQIKELLGRYGPVHSFFFDTPAEMDVVRAKQIEAILPATTLTNDRLYPGSIGSYRSYEGQLPREFSPRGPWELCMTINDTWGFKSTDQNWKSASLLKRTLIETATRGGNFLLNVGPDANGQIPAPAQERLKAIGQWMAINGESIHGTRRSAYEPIPWNGGCTTRILDSGESVLYAHLFERPHDGYLVLPGLTNKIVSVSVLGRTDKVPFERRGNSWRVTLPGSSADEIPVVKVVLEGEPVIHSPSLTLGEDGKIALTATTAVLKGRELRLERQSDSLDQNIGYWTNQTDSAAWSIDLPSARHFGTEWDIACAPDSAGSIIALMVGDKEVGRFEVPSTGTWDDFRNIRGPEVDLPAGTFDLHFVALSKPGLGVANIRGVVLSSTK